MGWIMREIRVHLEHVVVAVFERPSESSNVCGAEAHLPWALDDMQPRLMLHDTVDDVASSVRRSIVYDENLEALVLVENGSNQARDVLTLIIGRYDYQRALGHSSTADVTELRVAAAHEMAAGC